MKKLFSLLPLVAFLFLVSGCVIGPEGPEGPRGKTGVNGEKGETSDICENSMGVFDYGFMETKLFSEKENILGGHKFEISNFNLCRSKGYTLSFQPNLEFISSVSKETDITIWIEAYNESTPKFHTFGLSWTIAKGNKNVIGSKSFSLLPQKSISTPKVYVSITINDNIDETNRIWGEVHYKWIKRLDPIKNSCVHAKPDTKTIDFIIKNENNPTGDANHYEGPGADEPNGAFYILSNNNSIFKIENYCEKPKTLNALVAMEFSQNWAGEFNLVIGSTDEVSLLKSNLPNFSKNIMYSKSYKISQNTIGISNIKFYFDYIEIEKLCKNSDNVCELQIAIVINIKQGVSLWVSKANLIYYFQ